MTTLIIRELLMDIRNMFRGWKLIVHLVLLGLVILMSLTDEAAEVGYTMMLYCALSTSFIRIKLDKLVYLLPTGKQDRMKHVIIKYFGLLLYNILLYLFAISVAILLSDYRFSQELPTMLCIVIPVLMAYCLLNMGNGYNMGRSSDERLTKKYKRWYTISCLMAFPTIIFSFMLKITSIWELLSGMVIIIMTLISYCLVFVGIFFQISVLKNTELSEENVKRVEKL